VDAQYALKLILGAVVVPKKELPAVFAVLDGQSDPGVRF
jgi:hypothetical protein